MSKQNKNHQSNQRNHGRNNSNMRGKQGRKDSRDPRVNFDNERESKFVRQFEKRGMRADASANPNDISWYSRNPELLKSAASFPFSSVLGQNQWAGSNAYVPGIMVLPFTFTYGCPLSASNTDGLATDAAWYPEALNQAGKSMYSFLVHANSRNYTYEYQDLMMIVCAGIQVFAALAHVVRAYGIAKTYSEKSIYKPEAYLRAMGFDPIDFRNNLSQIWFDINQLIAQTTQIWIPSEMPLIKRWIWMCSSVFTDADSALGQTYVFVPRYFHQYNETASSNGGFLEPATYPVSDTQWNTFDVFGNNTGHQWNDWKAMIQHMINRLVSSEDRGIMFGDILNAYGADRIFALPPVDVNVRIEPVFNPEVLTQIENATISNTYCLGITQDSIGLTPIMSGPGTGNNSILQQGIAPDKPVLNFHQLNTPTPEQIVIATRLQCAGTYTVETGYITTNPSEEGKPSYGKSNQDVVCMPMSYGSEIIHSIWFVVKDSSTTSGWALRQYPYASATTSYEGPFTSSQVRAVCGDYLSFDWAPFIYWLERPTSTPVTTGTLLGRVVTAYGDYDNYTILDYYELAKLHQMALMSELGLPIL